MGRFDAEIWFGERVAVLGANGSGKSTLSLTLGGLLPPRGGAVSALPDLAAGAPTLVFSEQNDALYYDPNGVGPGYTLIAHVQPGAVVAAGDIHMIHGPTVA